MEEPPIQGCLSGNEHNLHRLMFKSAQCKGGIIYWMFTIRYFYFDQTYFEINNYNRLDYHNGWHMFRSQFKFAMHVWDIVIAFTRQIEMAYTPSILFGGLHIAMLAYCFANRKMPVLATAQ